MGLSELGPKTLVRPDFSLSVQDQESAFELASLENI